MDSDTKLNIPQDTNLDLHNLHLETLRQFEETHGQRELYSLHSEIKDLKKRLSLLEADNEFLRSYSSAISRRLNGKRAK